MPRLPRPEARGTLGAPMPRLPLRAPWLWAALLAAAPTTAWAADPIWDWDRELAEHAKRAVAVAAAALLAGDAFVRRGRRPARFPRFRDAALVVLAAAAVLAWTNLGRFHGGHLVHVPDVYHYYVGAKYAPELGYTRLYACTAVAGAEDGLESRVRARTLRNLATNEIESTARILAEPERCKAHFAPERWEAFRRDVRWFRQKLAPRRWIQAQHDHGYNASPAWTVLGGALAQTGPATDARMRALALLDFALLAAMAAACAWAFGWRSTCVALVFFGTSYLAPFGWTGGGLLRQAWLAAAVGGICLLRRGLPASGGFLLGTSALLRLFPGLLLLAVGIQGLLALRRDGVWSLPRTPLRTALGAVAAALVLVPLSAWWTGGLDTWADFAENSRLHLDTPLRNHVGWATVVAFDPDARARDLEAAGAADPYARFKEARRAAFERRWPLFAAGVAAFAALFAWAVRGREVWVAALLGTGLVVVAAELTSYYYSLLLGYGLLWSRHPAVGAALCGLSALSWGLAEVFGFYDEIFTWASLACVAFVAFATIAVGRAPRPGALSAT